MGGGTFLMFCGSMTYLLDSMWMVHIIVRLFIFLSCKCMNIIYISCNIQQNYVALNIKVPNKRNSKSLLLIIKRNLCYSLQKKRRELQENWILHDDNALVLVVGPNPVPLLAWLPKDPWRVSAVVQSSKVLYLFLLIHY